MTLPVSFTPSRLSLARRRRGLTKKALADKVGVSDRIITAYEAGEKAPSEETAVALAKALGFPIAFFSRPEVEEPSSYGASFRSLKSMAASARDKAISAGTLATEISAWIEERFELPTVSVPDLRESNPEQAAEEMRMHWGLGQRPIGNLIHLMEAHGVRVFSLDEGTRTLDAFSFWIEGKPFVFLNTQKTAEHSRFDAAHELGHLVLHRHGPPRGTEPERQAQAFASAFLMPKADFVAHAPKLPAVENLIRLKARWGVSVAALIYRLRTVDLVSDWQYRTLYRWISTRGYRTREPQPMERERSQVIAKVFRTLRAEGVGDTTIARDLSLDPADVHALVFGLVMAPLSGGGGPRSARSGDRPTLTKIK